MTKLLVIGWGRHGKDTVCEMLNKHGGLTFVSSSEYCAEHVVYPTMSGYDTWQECYADRHNHRAQWFETIKSFNEDDPAKLSKMILSEYDIYCGLRNIRELEAARSLFDLIIWVERPDLDKEDSDSMTIKKDDADIVLYNDGSLKDLEIKVRKLITFIPSLRKLQNRCFMSSMEAGWWSSVKSKDDLDAITPTKLCLIHSEISEAMEGHRKNLNDDKLTHRLALEVELADAVIRILDLAGAHELDIMGAVQEKMTFNATREDHKLENRAAKHGKKY